MQLIVAGWLPAPASKKPPPESALTVIATPVMLVKETRLPKESAAETEIEFAAIVADSEVEPLGVPLVVT